MTPDGPNPSKCQSKPRADQRSSTALPLVLIHDGGGTTSGFWALGPLHRDVWVLHNPRYWSGEPWETGMAGMAEHYVDLIKKAGISGKILLGGWSLGGFLSICMARLFALDPSAKIDVAGLLLLDTPYTIPWIDAPHAVSEPLLPDFPPEVMRNLKYCEELLGGWHLPPWSGPANNGEEVSFTVNNVSFSAGPGTVLHKPLNAGWKGVRMKPQTSKQYISGKDQRALPPPAVLLRCTKAMIPAISGQTDPCHVDRFRHHPFLGWEEDYPSFIRVAIDVEADHYTALDRANRPLMKYMTEAMNEALGILDTLEVSDDF